LQPRVIQGFFVGRPIRPALSPAAARAVQRRQVSPGRPALANAGAGSAVQAHGSRDSFEIDPVKVGLARGGGKALPEALLGKMEAAFSADFSSVRVHVGPQASRIGAIAFTTGNDIYFAPGQYQPDTISGQQLLGHELAHVVQQRQGRVRTLGGGVSVVQDRVLEAEADRLGARAAAYRGRLQAKMAGPARFAFGAPIQRAAALVVPTATKAGGTITGVGVSAEGNSGGLKATYGRKEVTPSGKNHAEPILCTAFSDGFAALNKNKKKTAPVTALSAQAFSMNAWPCADCDALLSKTATKCGTTITVTVTADKGGYSADHGMPAKSTGTITYP
jgi:hypothetical protein